MTHLYLVGVDGRNSPEPELFAKHNRVIEADSADEAVRVWLGPRVLWIREEEKRYIEVLQLDALVTQPRIWEVIRNG